MRVCRWPESPQWLGRLWVLVHLAVSPTRRTLSAWLQHPGSRSCRWRTARLRCGKTRSL